MTKVLTDARDDEDSVGGTVSCVIRGVPGGLGEPCFDKLEVGASARVVLGWC